MGPPYDLPLTAGPRRAGPRATAPPRSGGTGAVGRHGGGRAPEQPRPAEASRRLREYSAGRLREFRLGLGWSLTDGFDRGVRQGPAVTVPYGTVTGHQDLADRIGEPGAARAVGAAMGANPPPAVVPCHRVVAGGGGIGGIGGSGGGVETKRSPPAREGVLPAPSS